MKLRILHIDDFLVAVDKPAEFHVHPPEDGRPIDKRRSCLQILRKQIGREVHPVHRLDRATAGVLLFALDPAAAHALKTGWRENSAKSYLCLARGWLDSVEVNRPLKAPNGALKPAVTRFHCIAQREFDLPNKRHPTSRYSLLWAEPLTGRYHQIRRHL
ncbi:MAG: pseudouridylate synthase, partial [Bdellovibrionales bacterium]|nr:pseudouridylate synthase [Bdellovibrionales bacterium]